MTTYQIGPRQTVARACHPIFGEGRAVYKNGPAVFIPDMGDAIPMRSIDLGGMGNGYAFLTAVTMTGERVQLDTHKRPHGDHHKRRWSPIFGSGWLVSLASLVYPGNDASPADLARYKASMCRLRFEPDDGSAPIEWQWTKAHRGRLTGREPAHPKNGKAPSPAFAEWERWWTWGDYEFRDDAPESAQSGQLTMGGV